MLLRNSAMRPEQSLSIPSAPGHSMYLITCRGAVLRRMRRMSASVTPNPCKPCPSRSTRAEDQGRKRKVYASLGVGEYWLFDPTGDYLAHEDCATRSEQIRARDDNAGEVNDNSAETVRRSRLDGPLARFTPAAQIPRSRRLGERRFESRGTGRYGPAGAGPLLPSRTARRCTGGRPPRRRSGHR